MKQRNLLEEVQVPADVEDLLPTNSTHEQKERANRVIVEIPIDAIVETSALQTRQVTFDPAQFAEDAELLESVRANGVIEPILVQTLSTPLDEPVRYRLVFGNRRTQAARMAGRETVPAIIAHSREVVDVLTIAENSGRRELTAYEKARVLIQLKKQTPGVSGPELAKITGWPQPTVYALLSAYEKSPPVLRRLFAEGRASMRTIQEMQPVFEAVPEREHEALERLIAPLTHAEIVQIHHAVKMGQNPTEAVGQLPHTEKRNSGPQVATENEGEFLPAGTSAPGLHNQAATPELRQEIRREVKRQKLASELIEGDDAMIRLLVENTGIGRAAAERMLEQASAGVLTYNTLCIACLFVARGGEESQALELTRLAFRHRKAGGALRRQIDHLHALSAHRAWAASLPGKELQSFFQTIFRV